MRVADDFLLFAVISPSFLYWQKNSFCPAHKCCSPLRGLKLLIRLRGSEILLAGRKGYEIQLTGLKGSETLKTGYNEYNKRVTGVQKIIS